MNPASVFHGIVCCVALFRVLFYVQQIHFQHRETELWSYTETGLCLTLYLSNSVLNVFVFAHPC